MAYTSEDLAQLEAAILKLQNGERVVSVSYEGRSVNYAAVQLNELLDLRERMRSEIQIGIIGHKRRIQIITSKGTN